MEIKESKIPGCYEIQPKILEDERGSFVKIFHEDIFKQNQLETNFAEEYYSVSKQNVLRGLHFQLPPHDHVKMVYCVSGEVLDLVVDLRVDSPTYKKVATFTLSSRQGNLVYIPKGLAHGFYVLSEQAIMVYKVSTVYSPEHDTGILWNSVDFNWPSANPIISQRDQSFITCSEFNSDLAPVS